MLQGVTLGCDLRFQRKGYGSKLIRRIEKDVIDDARRHGQTSAVFDTTEIDSADPSAVGFFEKNRYTLMPEEGEKNFLVGRKTLILEPADTIRSVSQDRSKPASESCP